MAEEKSVCYLELIGLPPLRFVLGAIPSPDPDRRTELGQQPQKPGREMELPVKRLIAHLKGDQ